MAIYPCGDETGVYYLVVSGLPWSATWQKLKDFVRYPESGGVINVEHVFIYPSSTDGWVRIRGKEDFQRAYEFLNGRVFQGKAMAADDRNGYTIVNLRDMAPILTTVSQGERSTSSSPETYYLEYTGHASQALSSPPHNQHNYGDSYAMYRSSTQNSQLDLGLGSHSQLVTYSPTSTYSHVTTQSGYTTNYDSSCTSYEPAQYNYVPQTSQPLYLTSTPESSRPLYAQQMQIGYGPCLIPVGPVSQLILTPPPSAVEYRCPTAVVEENRQIIHSEPRKIIICQLPHSITDNELQVLLERATKKSKSRSTVQPDEYPIEHFEILRHSDGKPKGHAFATFFSPTIAKRAVDTLDGKKYQRRELKVRLTKEGVDSVHQPSPSPILDQEMYTVPPDASSQLVAQMGSMSMTGTTSTVHSSGEKKRERRDKGKLRTHERSYDVDNERDRSSKSRSGHHSTDALTVVNIERDSNLGVKSSQSVRGPLVVDGSGKRRHR